MNFFNRLGVSDDQVIVAAVGLFAAEMVGS